MLVTDYDFDNLPNGLSTFNHIERWKKLYLVKVKYQIATYSGEVSVNAETDDDNEVIIAKAKRQLIQSSGPLPFGYQSFEVIRT